MTLIEKFKDYAAHTERMSMQAFINSLMTIDDLHISHLIGIDECARGDQAYFLYSQNEAVTLFVDRNGVIDELLDEEEFNDESPLWFSEASHRVSPFYFAKCLTDALFQAAKHVGCDPMSWLTVVVTNAFAINFDDCQDEYYSRSGLLFHKIEEPLEIFAHDDGAIGTKVAKAFVEGYDEDIFYLPKLDEQAMVIPVGKRSTPKQSKFDEYPLPDIELGGLPARILPCLVNPDERFDKMVGLSDIRKHIREVVAFGKFVKKVKQLRPTNNDITLNLHAIIIGNPGTGKTTVSQYYGSLLHKAGLLSVGHTVLVTRSAFIGQNFGFEEMRMRQALESARGGVLFIDEVSTLIGNNLHPHDPGRGVIPLMLQLLADESQRDIAVVLALYNEHDLETLYSLNPGIKSRFTNILRLPDYSLTELGLIIKRRVSSMGMHFTRKAWTDFCSRLRTDYNSRNSNWGNARSALNLLQRVMINHALRCQDLEGEGLLRITARDIPCSEVHAPQYGRRRPMGFSA